MYYNVLSLATLMIHFDACHYLPFLFLMDADLKKSEYAHSVSPFLTLKRRVVHQRTSKEFGNL